jgi:hypothetical protein
MLTACERLNDQHPHLIANGSLRIVAGNEHDVFRYPHASGERSGVFGLLRAEGSDMGNIGHRFHHAERIRLIALSS